MLLITRGFTVRTKSKVGNVESQEAVALETSMDARLQFTVSVSEESTRLATSGKTYEAVSGTVS